MFRKQVVEIPVCWQSGEVNRCPAVQTKNSIRGRAWRFHFGYILYFKKENILLFLCLLLALVQDMGEEW